MFRISSLPVLCATLALVSSPASAQAPQSQPLVQLGNLAYLGKFTLPTHDAAGSALVYGGAAIGVGPDGASLYYGCHSSTRLARVTVPGVGRTASIVEPCTSIPGLSGINPSDPNNNVLGGTLSWNGRLLVSAYTYYDANYSQTTSHMVGGSIASLGAPYRVGSSLPGLVAGYMGVVPTEWRSLLGGPALTGQCCVSIISRTSYGPSASVFDPDRIGSGSTPSQMLVGYPDAHQSLGGYSSTSPTFNGSTRVGGLAFPAGTRSVLFVGRQGSTYCYGEGTTNASLHGAANPSGGIWCHDPTNPYKGPHGYPYRHQVWAYDALDLALVRSGAKNPWDVMPYGVWTLKDIDGGNGTATMQSVAYDPASRRLYVVTETGGNQPAVHVYEITNAVIQPPGGGTEVCGDGIDNDGDGQVDEGCPAGEPEICGDLIDNDGDGQVDEGCAGESADEVCGDGIDNDRDGLVDEDCEVESARPGAPQRLAGSVYRSRVSFRWEAPQTGGSVVEYVLEAGLSPGTTTFRSEVGVTAITVPDVGPGRYYVRVRARNGSGQSAPSNEVVVSVGCRWRPTSAGSQAWTDPDGCPSR